MTNPEQELSLLPFSILRDVARNESAEPRWRKAAMRLLVQAGSPMANIPDLAPLLNEIKAELDAEESVKSVVESAIEAPFPEKGPFKASVTTKTMFTDGLES